MKYKRTQKRSKQMWQRVEKFSIRKFSFGAASCLIGAQIAISGLANTAEAAMVTTRNDKGVVTLYANRGESPYDAAAIAVHDSINVDREIVVDVDWSSYSKTNPYVTVTYKYNGGFGASNYVANYGGSRPDYWFTTPVGAQEPSEIRLQTGTTDRVMKSWSADSPWVSFTNSVGSRYQTKEQVDSMGLGDDTKWERYNDTTQETGKTFLGDMAGMFNHRIGTQISDSPSDQGIFESFRTNTKSIYSDWDLARNDRVTITAKYKVADPTLKNGRRTLDFGAGVKVGRALQQLRHFKVVTTEIPVLYQDKELFEPVVPERIGVVDTAKLTAEEKTLLKNKIWEKNQATKSDAIPEHSHNKFIENVKEGDDGIASADSSISIADDGTATITYGDGTQDVIPGTSLVYEKPQIDNIETTPANVGDYKYLKNPHAVDNINSLTGSDIASARQKFFQVNGMTTIKNEDGDDVITAVGDPSKTSSDFVGTNLEYDPRSQGFAVLRNSMPVGITIPKADLFKAKPTKVFSAAEAIEKAKQAIDNLTYLSPKEKENYKNQLTGKTTQDDINNVVNAAIAKNSENEKAIEAKKRQVKDKINSAKYLTEAEKEAFRKQVDNQGIEDPANGNGTGTQAADYTKELLDKIGQQVDAKNLENAKKSTKEKIDQIKDSLKNPTADEYKTQIDGKTTVAEVEKVLEEAEKQKAKNEAQKAQEEAEKLKEDYKKQIDQIPGLSEADKAKYKQQIDQAKSKDQLENILNDAKAQASREKAKQTIEDLPHLNKAQKDELKEKVENASDKSEIDGIVSIAQGLDSKMDSLQKLVAEAEKVKNSDKYNTADQDKKTAFDKAKDSASKVADKTTAAPENAADTTEVTALIDKLAKAIEELTGKKVAVPVSKDALKAELDLNKDDAVKKSPAYAKETSADKKKAYEDALVNAQTVYNNPDATQPQVDEALYKLQQARLALSGKAEDFTLGVKEGAAKISVEPTVGAKLSEADKDAVKAKVTANGNDLDDTYTVEYGTIAEKDGKKVVPVTVTRDGVEKTIDVPVVKKAEEFTLAVKEETKPAEISKVPVEGESLTAEDQAKVKAKVIANGEALKDTDTVKYGTIAEKDGKKIVPVTVTRDGVEKTIDVPVVKKAEEFTLAVKEETKPAEISKVPVAGERLTAEDEAKVKEKVTVNGEALKDTDKVTYGAIEEKDGKKVVPVTVTRDGVEKTIDVPVVKKAEEFTLAVKEETKPAEISKVPVEGESLTAEDQAKVKAKVIANGEALKDTDTVKYGTIAEKDGKKIVPVTVTRDGVEKTIDVPVVKKAEEFTLAVKEETKPAEISKVPVAGERLTAEDEAKVKEKVTVNGEALKDTDKVTYGAIEEKDGKKVVPVTVTRDGVEKTIDVPVVGKTEAGKVLEKVKDQAKADLTEAAAKEKAEIEADKNLTDQAKADKKAEVENVKKAQEEKIDKAGTTDEVAKATDEGKKAIDAVHQITPDQAKSDLTEAANTEKGEIGGDKTLTDKEKEDLRAKVDEVKKAAEDKINNANTPEEVAKATEEGKKAIADVYNPQTVKGDSVTRPALPELSVQNALVASVVTVEKGQPLTDEDIKKQLVLTEDMVVNSIKKPSTTETGNKEAEVEITLADGSKVTVKVPVVVVESLENANTDNNLSEAKEEAKKHVEDAANKKIKEINNRTDLSDPEKTAAVEKVNKAKDDANTQIDNATSSGTAKAIGDAAAENIQKFDPKANPADIDQVDTSKLDEEKAKAIAEIEQAAKDQINAINNNKGLTSSQKAEAIKKIEELKAKAIEDVRKADSVDKVKDIVNKVVGEIKAVNPQPYSGYSYGDGIHSSSDAQANSEALANVKESAKNVIEKAAKDKQDEIKGAPLSDKEKAELLVRVEAEKQAALKEIENAKTVEDVKEAETIGVQAIAMVTVPKRPVAPNAAPQATSAPQATAGTMQDVTYQSPARKQLPNTGSASSAALASLGLVAATSGFALLGRKARRRK